MIQKKYLCKDCESAVDSLENIRSILSEVPHKSALLTFYEKGFSEQEVRTFVKSLEECGHPDLLVAGISLTLVAEMLPEGTGMPYSLMSSLA